MADSKCCHPNGVCVDDGCVVCQQPLRTPTNEELAYAAGIIDGEGAIVIAKVNKRQRGRILPTNYDLRVRVNTTDLVITPWLKTTFGGSTCHAHDGKAHHAISRIWTINARAAAAFLRMILPWLKLKRRQAELGLKFHATVRGPGKYIGDVVRAERAIMYETMKRLKVVS